MSKSTGFQVILVEIKPKNLCTRIRWESTYCKQRSAYEMPSVVRVCEHKMSMGLVQNNQFCTSLGKEMETHDIIAGGNSSHRILLPIDCGLLNFTIHLGFCGLRSCLRLWTLSGTWADWPSFSVTNTCSTCSIVARSREHEAQRRQWGELQTLPPVKAGSSSPMCQLFHGNHMKSSYEIIVQQRKSPHWQVSGYDRQTRHSGHLWPRWPHLPIAPWCHRHLRDGVKDLCTFMYFPYSFNGMQYVMMQLMQYLFPTLCVFSVCCLHWELKISKYTFNIIRLSCPNCLTEPLLPSQTELQSVAKLLFEYVDACSCHRTCTIHCWQRICISPSDALWIIQPSAGWTSHQHDFLIESPLANEWSIYWLSSRI